MEQTTRRVVGHWPGRAWGSNGGCGTVSKVGLRLFTERSQGKRVVWQIPASKNASASGYEASSSSSRWKTVVCCDDERARKAPHESVAGHLLPAGYPASVSVGYSDYAMYNFAASASASAAMVLSTQSLLLALGVGSATTAPPMAAAMNWIIKDGIGQFGGIVAASFLSSALDSDPKRWRVISALAMDAATLLEISTRFLPTPCFLAVASLANVLKNVAFLTASATRAALHQSLAIAGNLGDVTAKAASQSIAASLLGTLCGISISYLAIGAIDWAPALGVLVLCAINQGCTYLSLHTVGLKTFNLQRLHLLLNHFLEQDSTPTNGADPPPVPLPLYSNSVPSPEHVAALESFLPFFSYDPTWLRVGCSLDDLCPDGPVQFHKLFQQQQQHCERYVLNCKLDCSKNDDDDDVVVVEQVSITFLMDATGQDMIRGILHAHILHAMNLPSPDTSSGNEQTISLNLMNASHRIMLDKVQRLMNGLKYHKWQTDTEFVRVESKTSYRLRVVEG